MATTPSTGQYGPSSAWAYVDGYSMLAPKIKNLSYKHESLTEAVDGLGDATGKHSPIGKVAFSLTQGGGFFDTTALSGHAANAASLPSSVAATQRVLCCGFAGNAIGQPGVGFEGDYTTTYEVLGELMGLTKANAEHLITGAMERGVIVQHATAKTADWNTKTLSTHLDYTADPSQRVIPITSATKASPSVVTTTVPHGLTTGQKVLIASNTLAGPAINSDLAVTVISSTTFSVAVDTSGSSGAGTGGTLVMSDTPNGAAGYQHAIALSGFTGFVGKLRDSADDTTYADLITFANVTAAPAGERATVSGTVDRYVCFDGDVTGSGSITVLALLARL